MCRVWPQKTPTESNKSTVTPYLPIPLKGTTLNKKKEENVNTMPWHATSSIMLPHSTYPDVAVIVLAIVLLLWL